VHVQQQLVGFSAVCIWMDGLGMGKIGGIGWDESQAVLDVSGNANMLKLDFGSLKAEFLNNEFWLGFEPTSFDFWSQLPATELSAVLLKLDRKSI
jgi:hypothetical protein